MLLPLHALPLKSQGLVELLVVEGTEMRTLSNLGLAIGSRIESVGESTYLINEKQLDIAPSLASQILIRTQ